MSLFALVSATLDVPNFVTPLAAAASQPTTQGGAADPGFLYQLTHGNPLLVPMIVGLVIFYIFVIRSKRTQEKQKQSMLQQMKKGDRIQTIGGILGSVVEPRDDRVLVKVDESSNTKIWFSRNAIARVVEEDGKESRDSKVAK